jgi:ribose 5-phosphate isomerase B
MVMHSSDSSREALVRRLVEQAVEALVPDAPGAGPDHPRRSTAGRDVAGGAADEVAGDRALDAAVAIALGADHAGYALKQKLLAYLEGRGYRLQDCGTTGTAAVDYPDFAVAVARLVAAGTCRWGIIVDGAGIGSCIVANKVPGVRAAACHDVSSARNSREHNHANVLTLGAGFVGEALARQIVDAWLATPWGAGRHARRVELIEAIERQPVLSRPSSGRTGEDGPR